MTTILGLVMIYSWIHAVIILNKNKELRTQYENVVVIVALTGIILFVIGTLMA